MNVKNLILVILAVFGGGLFLFLQKYSKEYYSSFEQPRAPLIEKSAARYQAPDFILADLDKNEFQLSGSRGNVVAMMFWTTW